MAQQRNLDPIGSASGVTHQFILLEVPTPWPDSMYSEPGKLPNEVLDIFPVMRERYQQKIPVHLRVLFIAPETAYSKPGFRRVMYLTKPEGPFARYTRHEYWVPDAEAGPLCWVLAQLAFELPEAKPDDLARFEPYRVRDLDESVRDLLVCTHGSVDAACAKFGYPLYRLLRDQAAQSAGWLRTWRVTHFGGHVYAPTLLDLPSGRYWGFIGKPEAEALVKGDGPPDRLRKHYRGWSGLEHGFEQVLEREIWQREGWAWFDAPKHGRTLAEDTAEAPQWAEVELTYAPPGDQPPVTYHARIVVTHHIETPYSSGDAETYAYPQYEVTNLRRV